MDIVDALRQMMFDESDYVCARAADEIERLSKLVMEQAIDIAYLHSERDALKAAGTKLSNIAYNLAQAPGSVLSQPYCDSLDNARREWDAAIDAARGE